MGNISVRHSWSAIITSSLISCPFFSSSSDDSSEDSFDSNSGGPSSTENQNCFVEFSGWNSSQVESGFEDDFDRISTPSSSDPWSDTKPDPFSPQRKSVPNLQFAGGRFEISNDDPKSKKRIISPPTFCKPTVIRPNLPIQSRRKSPTLDSVDHSPPMPSIPPPPPPPEALELLAHGPPIPPRPTESFVSF